MQIKSQIDEIRFWLVLEDVYWVYWAYVWLPKRYENTQHHDRWRFSSPSKSHACPFSDVFPDHPSPGRGVAPGALCVCVMQQGARHPRVLRERRTGLLWEGLPSSLFPSLWILQEPNHGGSSTHVDVVINKWVDKKHPNWWLISENVVVSGRKSWQPWTRVGILNTFSAPTVETCLGRKVRYPVPNTCTSC